MPVESADGALRENSAAAATARVVPMSARGPGPACKTLENHASARQLNESKLASDEAPSSSWPAAQVNIQSAWLGSVTLLTTQHGGL